MCEVVFNLLAVFFDDTCISFIRNLIMLQIGWACIQVGGLFKGGVYSRVNGMYSIFPIITNPIIFDSWCL